MILSFALCVSDRLIIYENKLSYLFNRSNPHTIVSNHSKAINIDKIVASLL